MQKILVIEDEDIIRENILDLLEAEKFRAKGAKNGRLGLEYARQEDFDLILCDVVMPELDGYEVLKTLRQNPSTATTPFIFLTAKGELTDFRTGMELGADDYLTKPFTRSELLQAIATRLQKQAALTRPLAQVLQQATEQLNQLISYNPITHLPNRYLLQEEFHQLQRQHQNQDQTKEIQSSRHLTILLLELDRFQRIRDFLGADFSDLLLKSVAERLAKYLDEEVYFYHLNDIQFSLLLTNGQNAQEIEQFCQGLLEVIAQPFLLSSREIFITASVGIVQASPQEEDLEKLLKQANKAMEQAHLQGGNQYQFHIPQRQVQWDLLSLENSLRHAFNRQELAVYYQPQVSLKTGQIIGTEALVRWHHPEQGLMTPDQFIPIAEETGLILPISEWILQVACEQTKIWQQQYSVPLHVSVNLSNRQFYDVRLEQTVLKILQQTGIQPQFLELELTEGIVVKDPLYGREKMASLKQLGVEIAIDDFGTGYSSLSYLKQFSFDTLKIDQCFIRNVTQHRQNQVITKAMIELAHNLNLKVVAEGIETPEELAFVQNHGCGAMQGYLFSRPLPTTEFSALLASGKTLNPSIIPSMVFGT